MNSVNPKKLAAILVVIAMMAVTSPLAALTASANAFDNVVAMETGNDEVEMDGDEMDDEEMEGEIEFGDLDDEKEFYKEYLEELIEFLNEVSDDEGTDVSKIVQDARTLQGLVDSLDEDGLAAFDKTIMAIEEELNGMFEELEPGEEKDMIMDWIKEIEQFLSEEFSEEEVADLLAELDKIEGDLSELADDASGEDFDPIYSQLDEFEMMLEKLFETSETPEFGGENMDELKKDLGEWAEQVLDFFKQMQEEESDMDFGAEIAAAEKLVKDAANLETEEDVDAFFAAMEELESGMDGMFDEFTPEQEKEMIMEWLSDVKEFVSEEGKDNENLSKVNSKIGEIEDALKQIGPESGYEAFDEIYTMLEMLDAELASFFPEASIDDAKAEIGEWVRYINEFLSELESDGTDVSKYKKDLAAAEAKVDGAETWDDLDVIFDMLGDLEDQLAGSME